MTSPFIGTVALLLEGKEVRASLLVVITFNDGQIERLFNGIGNVRIGGNVYRGLQLLSVEGLEAQIGTTSRPASFSLSGIDADINSKAVAEADLIPGSTIECSIQIFGDGENGGEWQPVDSPIGLGKWVGDHLNFDRQSVSERRLTLTAVSFFENRSRPPASYYSARDQEQRYPGDRGGEFMPGLANKIIKWPFEIF